MTTIQGVIHGKTIELENEPGLPDGQPVSVAIEPIVSKQTPPKEPPLPWWLQHLAVDPTVRAGKFVIKGTRLLADAMVEELEAGQCEQALLQAHPELTPKDVAAVCEYAKLPVEMRRSFGGWADEAEELDKYLEWNRGQRKLKRRRIED